MRVHSALECCGGLNLLWLLPAIHELCPHQPRHCCTVACGRGKGGQERGGGMYPKLVMHCLCGAARALKTEIHMHQVGTVSCVGLPGGGKTTRRQFQATPRGGRGRGRAMGGYLDEGQCVHADVQQSAAALARLPQSFDGLGGIHPKVCLDVSHLHHVSPHERIHPGVLSHNDNCRLCHPRWTALSCL